MLKSCILFQFFTKMFDAALLLGDSQTQLGWGEGGWVTSLAEKYVRKVDIINRGLSGYNTRMLLNVLPDILDSVALENVKIVTLMMGSNDASFPETNPEQAVPLEEFGENLLKIISMLLNKGIKKESIVIMSPPPILPEKWTQYRNSLPGPKYENCKDNQLTKQYAAECGKVAGRMNITFVDLFTAMMGLHDLDAALSDGLHLGKPGHVVLVKHLSTIFDEKLGSSRAEKLMLPEWREMTNSSLQQCGQDYNQWKKDNPDRL